jgi:adenosylcobinamide kinase/adenosylcobinamide-phosphate guanylyltransferase
VGLILVLGGTRSGKSEVAERVAGLDRPVTYLATGVSSPDDAEFAERVALHRQARPDHWETVEVGPEDELVALVATTGGALLLDSLGTWLAVQPGFRVDGDLLAGALADRSEPTVVVSDEVGLGVHPSTAQGRQYRDALGSLNRAVAARADRVLLIVAGRVLELDEL